MQKHMEGLDANAKKSISMVLVCAGTTEGGRAWREKTGVKEFPILADSRHEFLDNFKFPRSTWNTGRPEYAKTFVYNARQAGGQAAFPKSREVFEMAMKEVLLGAGDSSHDMHQMGGTIVLTPEGKVLYTYKSKTSTDRPPATTVFAAIKK